MFRRSSIIIAISLALLSTLDSATCFAAAAPALPREDVDRPRFLKKEIKRFVFTNVTTSISETPEESLTSVLEDTLTSLSSQEHVPEATPTSATSAITTIPSVTPSVNGETSALVSSLSAGDVDRDREALLALAPVTTSTPVSSTPPSSVSTSDEGAITHSSTVPGGESSGVTGLSQSLSSSSATPIEVATPTTHSSFVEQPGNGVTSTQLGSTTQLEIGVTSSGAAVRPPTSSSIASETPISNPSEQSSGVSGPQTSTSPEQQTNTQVQAPHSSSSSEGAVVPPTATPIAVTSSLVPPAQSNSQVEAGLQSSSSPGQQTNTQVQASHSSSSSESAVVLSTATPIAVTSSLVRPAQSSSQAEVGAVTTATDVTPPPTTSAGVSVPAVPGDTTKSSTENTDNHSLPGGVTTSGIPVPSTTIDSGGSANTKTDVVPTTSGGGAEATTTHAAEPASSPNAPQSASVTATGTAPDVQISPTTAVLAHTQSAPAESGAGPTSHIGGPLESTTAQQNPTAESSSIGAIPIQTTLPNGAVVSTTAQITGAVKDTTTTPETPPASVSVAGGHQSSEPNPNAETTAPASVANPSLAPAAAKLNTIPASIKNPLASVSGNPASVFNPALVSAASVVDQLPASVQNPEHQNSLAGSPNPTLPVSTGANPSGEIPPNTESAIFSPVATNSAIGVTGSPKSGITPPVSVTGSPVTGNASPVSGKESPTGVTGSPVSVTAVPGGSETESPATGTAVSVGGGTESPATGTAVSVGVGTESPATGTAVSVGGGTESPATGTAVPVGSGTAVSVGGGTESPAMGTAAPVASGTASLVGSGTESPMTGTAIPVASGTASLIGSGTESPNGATDSSLGKTALPSGVASLQASGEPTTGPVSGQNPEATALGSGVPESGSLTVPTAQSATPESGIAGYSTQSNGQVVPISAAAGTGSSVSNGQIVPAATDHEASGQLPVTSETGAIAASIAAQSASAAAAGATQTNAAPIVPAVTSAKIPPQKYYGNGPYTQSPVGYDTSTTQLVPTSIVHGPSSTPSATSGHNFGPTSFPSNVPQMIYQNGGPGTQPPHTRLINIAMRYPLNYLFVYNQTVAQQQLFYYIPLGICYGLEIEVSRITMQSLRAWDTYEDVGYYTTLVLAYVPEDLVDNLGILVSTPFSRFYTNPDNSTAFLLSMVNNAIAITGSNGTDGPPPAFGNIPTDTPSAKDGGAPIGGDIGNSEHVRASSVGIGVGVACGAAAYGAAMFFVARRYKKRRQSHLRSPSMLNSPVMSHTGPDAGAGAALMSGAMGERSASPYYDNDGRAGSRGSGRSGSSRHQISAPVMAENSLGWN